MPRVTLQTIAERLGVSRTTVSNAWSRPDQLSSDLRERILAVADELGYAGPDPAARSLRRGRADAIGLLLTEALAYAFADAYARDLLRGVALATDAADTGLLLVPLPIGRQIGAALRGAAVDGFIVYSMPEGHPAVDLLRQRGIPLVTIDGPRLPDVPFVGIDDRAAAAELTGRVLAAGHERLHGVLQACRDAGVARGAVEVHEVGLNTRAGGRRVVAAALERDDPPTAVVAISDELAAGAVDAAQERGWRVPEHLSVVGYDDLPLAEDLGLTTVRQPGAEKGRRAAGQLLGEAESGDVLLAHTIIERTSVGPPSRPTPGASRRPVPYSDQSPGE